MPAPEEAYQRLAALPSVHAARDVPLSRYTRFGIGGPADVYAETSDEGSFLEAWRVACSSALAVTVIGGGTNLIVSDAGFRGIVLRFIANSIEGEGTRVRSGAGVVLQDLVDFAIARGLKGLETLSGIPGWVGAAVYGNAGAYGHSLSERVTSVRFATAGQIRELDNAGCQFRYRESIFKSHKDWIILSVLLDLEPAGAAQLRTVADGILAVRNEKFPPTMKCAGSIFKNLLLRDLPERLAAEIPAAVVREGKVPAAWFLEQVGAKGMTRGDIHIASYHANLIYNAGGGTAADLCALILELKGLVRGRFGIEIEEEVQYVGFDRTGSDRVS